MKKILLSSALISSLFVTSVYAEEAVQTELAKTGIVISGEGSWIYINKIPSGLDRGVGLGLGAYVGYDFAINNYFTIGGKTGYFHSFDLLNANVGDHRVSSDNIPLLATVKYFVTPKVYVGGELGVNFQRITLTSGSGWSASNNYNAGFMFGGLIGYNINNKISVSGSLDYITGNDASDILLGSGSANKALANMKLGLQLNYSLPM